MRHGVYVACFVNAPDERIVLSLQHGAADALREWGHDAGLRHLRDRAAATRDGLPGHGFDTGPITLGSDAALPQGYQAGCVLSRIWDAGAPDADGFDAALSRMLDLYRGLVGP